MKIVFTFLLVTLLYQSSTCQQAYVKISVNDQDVEINRFYYLDDYNNMVFLESENTIHLLYPRLQLIDGKNDISYILKAGDDLNIPFSNGEYAFPESKTDSIRSIEIQYSVKHYKEFQTKFFKESSLPKSFTDSLYIANTNLRDSLFLHNLEQEIFYLKKYKEHYKLSESFFEDQKEMLVSFYTERDLIAGFFPFSDSYLNTVLARSFSQLDNSNLLYLSSCKRSLMYYLKTYKTINADKEYISIVNEKFSGILNTYIKAYLINEALKQETYSLIKLEDEKTVIKDFLGECRVERYCNYISQKILKGELLSDQLMDIDLNQIKFDDITGDRITYIVFWASWCGPCIKSIKETNEIRAKLSDEKVDIIFISIDKEIENWRKMVMRLNLKEYPNYIVSDSSAIFKIFDLKEIPQYAIIKKGSILLNNVGPLSESETVNKIMSLKP